MVTRSLVSLWHGVYLLEDGKIVRALAVPSDPSVLAERLRARMAGTITPEEKAVLEGLGEGTWGSRDRRLVGSHVEHAPRVPFDVPSSADRAAHREAILRWAERALVDAWDPSVHIEEAVRTLRDLDRSLNLLGERVAGWAAHDAPGVDADDPVAAARAILGSAEGSRFAPDDVDIRAARRRLADAFLELRGVREELGRAIDSAAPKRTPNLSALLGPELASRLVAQAGGLDRLARLPASTVQVLGAEKAFFEHLRGRAPPPRHGLLFLHPAIQSAGRSDRGKLARSLAAKAVIAARLDRAGAAVDATLEAAFARRREELRRRRPAPGSPPRRRTSRAPLHRASEHR